MPALIAVGTSVLAVETSPGVLDALTVKVDQHGWTTVDINAGSPATLWLLYWR